MRMHAVIATERPRTLIKENTLFFINFLEARMRFVFTMYMWLSSTENLFLSTIPGLKKRIVFQINLCFAFFCPKSFSSRLNFWMRSPSISSYKWSGQNHFRNRMANESVTFFPCILCYSCFNDSDGFVEAAFHVCDETETKAMISTTSPEIAKIHGSIPVR